MYYLWLSYIILWFFFVTLFSLHGTNSLLQLANTKRKSCFLFKRHNYGVYYQVYKIDRQHNSKVHCLAYHAKNATCTLPSFCSHPLHFSECPGGSIVTKFRGRWGRGMGSRNVVRYLREIFTLRVENEPVNPGRGQRTWVEGRRWWTRFMWLW